MLKVSQQQQAVTIEPSNNLVIQQVSMDWQELIHILKNNSKRSIILNLAQVKEIDSSGVAMLAELSSQFPKISIQGISEQYLEKIEEVKKLKASLQEDKPRPDPWLVRIGKATENIVLNLREDLVYIGEITFNASKILFKPKTLRWKDVWLTMEKTGPNALPIILLLGFLMGVIVAFQSAIPLRKFGAVVYVANLVGVSLARELGPLLVAIILAGRTASAFAAEIGTMKINQEIDALTTMGLKPVLFLALPRIFAVTCMTPILNLFMIVAGLIGCFLFMHGIGYSWSIFAKQIDQAVTPLDLWGGLIKAFVFGFLLACIGCIQGLKTRIGASAVGDSTTQAVVSCIVMIVVVDGIFAVLYYILGI